jgi:predicted O-methyltransferase YrrM
MKMREMLKELAKTTGCYDVIRDAKAKTYRFARDARLPLGLLLSSLMKEKRSSISRIFKEFEESGFVEHVSGQLKRYKSPAFGASSWVNLRGLYTICRISRPEAVVETGVASGASSLAVLMALRKNKTGHLYSIDLPPSNWENERPEYRGIDHVSLPENMRPGWLVAEKYRDRWTLILGDTRKELPPLLEKVGKIDLFYHDAEHTYEAMLWEYQTVWPYLPVGGVLTSDDVTWNSAFEEFSARIGQAGRPGRWFDFGMIQKCG